MLGKLWEIIKSKLVLIIVVIIILVLFIWIMSLIGKNSSSGNKYDRVLSTMENAAIKYYSDKINELPTNGKTVSITDGKLVSSNYMKSINEILEDKTVSCTGEVSVTNVNGEYKYTPKLDCGDKYRTVTLVDKINSIPTVEAGNGLYKLNNKLVYRGEHLNNYITINNNLYRILKLEDSKVYLVADFKVKSIPWDDRYNVEKDSRVGINDYAVSRIKENLDEIYADNKLFTVEDKKMMSTQTLNIGKKSINDIDTDGSIEKSVTLENQYLGVLTINDYMNASTDSNCKKASDTSCTNYNYLANAEYSYWLLTADANTTYKVYKYNYGSGISLYNASSNSYIRPVVALNSDTLYVSGNGTQENPYIIK